MGQADKKRVKISFTPLRKLEITQKINARPAKLFYSMLSFMKGHRSDKWAG
jgi:hypothetical protein